MAEKKIILAYRRVPGDLSTGSIFLVAGEGEPMTLHPFESIDFRVMMRQFAVCLLEHPDAGGAIQRTDRPGLVEMPLRADELALFRTDPAEAIRRYIVPPQRVVIGIDRAAGPDRTVIQVRKPDGTVLEAGFESLAQYFGDDVYARYRERPDPEVECPVCGTWTTARDKQCDCAECGVKLPIGVVSREAGFAGFKVSVLLSTDKELFFLPRRWNTKGNWITRVELQRLHNEYNKEKTS